MKGLLQVYNPDLAHQNTFLVKQECTPEEEAEGLLQVIYEDGKFYNQTNLEEIRERIKSIV